MYIKGPQRFFRIPGKSRNGTEGTEILGNPVPVTGIPTVAPFLPDHARPTRGTARTRRGSEAFLTARRLRFSESSCRELVPSVAGRRALSWTRVPRGGYDGSLSSGYLATGTSGGHTGTERIGTDRNRSDRIGSGA